MFCWSIYCKSKCCLRTTAFSEASEGFFFKGQTFKEEVGEARRELRYSGKDASGAKRITVQIKSCPNSQRPLNVQVQKLAALSQGHQLWRRPSCGHWCPRLGVPAPVWTSRRGALQQRAAARVPCSAAGELRAELSTPRLVSNAVQTAGMQAPSWEIPLTLLN